MFFGGETSIFPCNRMRAQAKCPPMPSDHRPTVSGRVHATTVERLDRIAQVLGAKRPGELVKRSDALRVAIERGVEVLERELGIEAEAAPAKPASTAKKGAAPARKPAK